ncbi:hypothetical protein B9Z55_017284 [Caenorhabditis nigoni]|uniref:RING-type domain-containing protein n=1 Tax=Caenorhabditis nigoni TaxID=1611254 RepID=A0A2G5T8Q3_9PELO|nr:hypothetical protein B9Z55_017284 [Caenorhabditis nigoni]
MLVSSKDMVFSSENVKKLVKRCIPKELIPVDWKCDKSDARSNLESLLECSRGQLGMFENVTALFQALTNFLTAPGCANLLQFNGIYTTLPLIHNSIRGVEYIYKKDVLELISLAVPCPFKDWQAELVRIAVKSRLKCFEADWKSRFNSHCEMVKVVIGKLKVFAANLFECANALFKNTELCMPNLPDFSNVESTDGSYEMLKSFDEKYPIEKNKQFYTRMFSWVMTVGKLFNKVLEENFMSDDSKVTVRLFKIGKDSYVMAHELLQSMKTRNMDVSEFEEEVLQMSNLATFNFREVAQKVKIEDMKNIEFIRITSKVSTIAIPIPAPDGTYCVPATDALYDLISDMIMAKKVLQGINRSQFEHIQQFFNSMEHMFPVEGGDYFISMEDVELMKAKWEKTYEDHFKSSAAVRHIRKVRKGGFTEDDLDKELGYLNLYNCFPEMKLEVELAYKVVNKERNSTLKLEDMHSAVFQCQMAILLGNLPNVYKFLHNQKMCMKWVPYLGCVMCEMAALPTLKKLLNKPSPTKEELKDLMETTTVSEVAPTPKESEVVVEEKDQDVSSDVPKKKRSKKTKKSEESNRSTSESSSSPEPKMPEASKESQSCPKCSRASHFADAANEKLRVSKVECKHLKKELANAELEVEVQKQKGMDKDERIRMLEELLKSKNDIIERQNMDLLQKQDVIMNLEMEVESNYNIIQENSTTIEHLEKSLKKKDYRINELEAQQSSEVRIMEPTRSDVETEKVRDVLFKLLEIQGTIKSGNPVLKCRELAQRICMKAQNKEIEDATRIEAIKFCKKAKIYIQAVNTQLEMIRGSRVVKPEEIPDLPEFPALSRRFLKTYEDLFKSEAPKICQSLLKTPEVKPGELADTDCLICIEEMESEEGTIKCECCKRRYHTECVQEWFKTKRTCPACSSVLLDDSEFPALGQR